MRISLRLVPCRRQAGRWGCPKSRAVQGSMASGQGSCGQLQVVVVTQGLWVAAPATATAVSPVAWPAQLRLGKQRVLAVQLRLLLLPLLLLRRSAALGKTAAQLPQTCACRTLPAVFSGGQQHRQQQTHQEREEGLMLLRQPPCRQPRALQEWRWRCLWRPEAQVLHRRVPCARQRPFRRPSPP